jgi:hypothetical protein
MTYRDPNDPPYRDPNPLPRQAPGTNPPRYTEPAARRWNAGSVIGALIVLALMVAAVAYATSRSDTTTATSGPSATQSAPSTTGQGGIPGGSNAPPTTGR